MRVNIALMLLLPFTMDSVAAVMLDEKIMTLSLNAAKLSDLSYYADHQPDGSLYEVALEDPHYYTSEESPDMAIVAKIDGYCYASFRGTESSNLDDWMQNFDPRTDTVCNEDGGCCDARQGFVTAYNAPFKDQLEADLLDCAASCDDMDECIVITGHSQGGAIANLAAIINFKYNPYIITFGQPGAVHEPCPYINSEKYYRYINSVIDRDELEHDPVSFSPMLGSSFQGYMIVLCPQSDAVASYGLDAHPDFLDFDINVAPFQAHSMDGGGEGYGYIQRIEAVMSHNQYPISCDGWKVGEACSDDGECISGRCDSNKCSDVLGSCEPCNEDSDCASGNCYLLQCTRLDLLIDNGCNCFFDSDCDSGRCEGITNWQCEPKKYNGESCNEDSDCLSNNCNWWFKCSGSGGDEASAKFHFY